ncbi:hypothetical protein ACLMJK_008988 [Lecanora helva]
MSLRVDNGRSRGRSKSPGRRDERSRSRDTRAPSPAVVIQLKESKKTSKKDYSDDSHSDAHSRKKSSKKYYSDSESDSDPRSRKKSSKKRYDSDDSDSDAKSRRKSSRRHHDESDSDEKHRKKSSKKYYSDSDSDDKKKTRSHRSSKKHHDKSSSSSSSEDDRKSKHKSSHRRGSSSDSRPTVVRTTKGEYVEISQPKKDRDRHGSYDDYHQHRPVEYKRHLSNSSLEGGEKYRQLSMPGGFTGGHSPNPQYAQPQPIIQPESHRGLLSSQGPQYAGYPYSDRGSKHAANGRNPSYTMTSQPQFVEARPHQHEPPSLHRLSVSGSTPSGMLGVATPGQHGPIQGGLPPGSPLLEAYRGTYQSISPMPSPLMLTAHGHADDDLSDLEPLDGDDSDDSRGHRSISTLKKKSVKTVSFYDPEPDALAIAAALKHSTPETKPILKILPHLSDDHVMMLRTEYKKHMKTQGKGVNVAKHIKMKLSGNLGKVAYATALGRWESEAHWANFWYQSNSSRRELLIESLMGRSNSEIVKIKDAFSDQRYNNSLEKCMQTELKKDKFRNAVLLVLEEKRMLESEKLHPELVRQDAQNLYRALTAKEGGETAMINIIVVRSDRHLAEVLRVFEAQYRKNFAREMIKKSQNLVGETLAHILNGVLNRPVRDALLLHQALEETSKDRSDLLVSRLVRFHWEPNHMEKIKLAYKQKYGERLETAIDEGTRAARKALLELGFIDCYHYWAWIENPAHSATWKRAYEAKFLNKGTLTRDNWDEILGNYQAVTDNPCVYFAPELIAAYPEAKVILQTRELSSWYKSFETTIAAYCRDPLFRYLCYFDHGMKQWWPVSRKMHYAVFEGDLNRENAIAVHQRSLDTIRALVPKDRLLEWKVADGWSPLCSFLGVKQPEGEFPRVNDSAWFVGMMQSISRDLVWKAVRAVGLWVIAVAVGVMGIWWYVQA